MKKAYHKMLMSGGILIGDVNNYPPTAAVGPNLVELAFEQHYAKTPEEKA